MENKTWDEIWKSLITNSSIKLEYQRAFLLNMFQKICSKMSKDKNYRSHILTLFRQTKETTGTTKAIIKKEFGYVLNDDEAKLVNSWFLAYRKKQAQRKTIALSVKKQLFEKQNGLCAACGQDLGTDWSKVHVDHIIPWVLVGDELEGNYQDLCETCNECKSSRTDYVFKSMINLV